MPLRSKLANFAGRLVPLEKLTEGVVITNSNHSQIHVGNAYSIFYRISQATINTELDLVLSIPSATYVHFQMAVLSGNGAADLDMYEDSSLTLGTSVMTPVNRNRISTKTSALNFNFATAVSVDGTHLDGDSLYGSSPTNARASAGRASDENEWVFDNDPSLYHFRITNRITDWEGIFKAFWYEESAGYAG